MKYLQIVEIKSALTELSKERLPIAYEIAKNIRICNNAIQEMTELSRTIFENFADKDEDGNFIKHQVGDDPNNMQLKISNSDALNQYQIEFVKLLDVEHDVHFVMIPKARIQTENLLADVLIPLIDVIIN